MATSFDLIIIGGGSGGLAMAKRAAEYGQSVALIEGERLGGTCVNRGCVPKKVMWYGAHVAETLHHAGAYGFSIEHKGFDWKTLVDKREAYIERINQSYGGGLDKLNIQTIKGWGRLVDANTVSVYDDHYHAERIVIATGGEPSVPNIPGAEHGIDSDGFFALDTQPKRVAVIGAGYIAVEIAGVFQALGSDVTQVLRKHQPLREFDHSIGEQLMQSMQQAGIHFETQVQTQSLSQHDDGSVSINTETGSLGPFDQVVWAIGRRPRLDGIGLDSVGLALNERGFLPVDEWQQTTVPSIFALGDITGAAQLTPVAIAAGRRLADRLYNNMPDRKLDQSLVPTVVFSHPPIATMGLSEAQAKTTFDETSVKTYIARFNPMYYMPLDESEKVKTVMKLVVQGDDERVVGLHIIGRDADEIAQGFAVAMRMGATKKDFDDTIAIHPTSGEELVTMR